MANDYPYYIHVYTMRAALLMLPAEIQPRLFEDAGDACERAQLRFPPQERQARLL